MKAVHMGIERYIELVILNSVWASFLLLLLFFFICFIFYLNVILIQIEIDYYS